MTNAFMVSGFTKTYQDFVLDHVSFTVPSGSIVGLIGENGAGKSTTINAALGLIQKEDGVVSILDSEELDGDVKEQIGVVFDGSNYPEILSPRKLNRVMKNIYRTWDEQAYLLLLKQFSLPADKQIRQFSRGMKMKLAISVAFSHHSRLLVLDEATSGLDPVVRDDILDMLLDFVQDEEHSILVSSHITSDLEKIADYIVFIHEGKVVFEKTKDELAKKNDEEQTIFRRRNIGFIFQNYNLVPILNVYENIVLPVELDGDVADEKFMDEIVRMLALEDKLQNMPNNLSGGQQQRVAIARALITKPAIILADEPTGNLDSRTSADVLGLLKRTGMEFNQTIVMITHNNEIAQLADRIVRIEDGRIEGQIAADGN